MKILWRTFYLFYDANENEMQNKRKILERGLGEVCNPACLSRIL